MVAITLEELNKHNTSESSWVAIHGKVYDVTKFEEHPPGLELILQHAGADATQEFDAAHHPPSSKEYLDKLYIGDLVESSCCQSCQPSKCAVMKFLKSQDKKAISCGIASLVVLAGAAIFFIAKRR